jgi:aspartyl-tRNA(Asn)/glutamyl-tRNA(Gln) amidotransferase subunit A
MSSADLVRLGALEAARRIRDGKLAVPDLVEACLERIKALDGGLRAWAHLDEAGARALAAEREAEACRGAVRGPLHGVPVGIKDIFDVAGLPTTGGARPWAHTRPTRDAVAVARLRAAGAIVLGKTVTTEFAYRDPAPTGNPWRPGHTPGGSSAGSAAAVAARMVPLALGSQTVGSVLRPAAYCGVVGVKLTHGRIPVAGVIPLAWSLDHVGVLARSVADAALGLGLLLDTELTLAPPSRPRLALATELLDRAEPEVAAQIRAAAGRLARAGADVQEIRLPASFAGLGAAGLTILEVEAAAYHEPHFRAHGQEYGKEIGALVENGLRQSATTYVRADRERCRVRDEVMPLLAAHDALLSPTAPAPAPAGLGSTGDGSLCAPWSNIGVPTLTLPSGLAPSGLPHALQLTAAVGRDAALLGVAQWCEQVLAFTAAPSL